MDLQVFESREAAEHAVAAEVAALVSARPSAVLGLASGETPTGVYRELVRRHRETGLDFSRVLTFNLDEYLGVDPADPRSFRACMRAQLFGPAGIPLAHTRFPDGWEHGRRVPVEALGRHCDEFERAIVDAGGIDMQILGIGRNGHIGFNEPGSAPASRTRMVELQPQTRADAARAFGDVATVPTHALTMGVGTILDARAVRVLAFGEGKRGVVARTLATIRDPLWPASLLHGHPDVRLIVDRAAEGPR